MLAPQITKTLLAATATLMLIACGSNDNSNNGSAQARSEQRVVLGNRSSEASFKPILSQPADTKWQSYDRPADYAGVTKLPTTFITMRDGVQLAASVTLPALSEGQVDTGKYPTILIQTSYNLTAGSFVGAIGGADPFMVQRGYATVVVDVRGTGNSTGNWEAFGADEQADFKEVAENTINITTSVGNIWQGVAIYVTSFYICCA